MDMKECTKCGENKSLSEFYSKTIESKKLGTYIKYYSECKECAKKRSRKWQVNNPEKSYDHKQKYEQSEKRKISNKNKLGKYKEYQKEWRQNNKEYMRVFNQTRRATKLELVNDFTLEQWIVCLEYFNHCCAYCDLSEEENRKQTGKGLEQEHIIPLSKGGGYTAINILPACRNCNASKHKNNLSDWYNYQIFYSREKEEKINTYLIFVENRTVGSFFV